MSIFPTQAATQPGHLQRLRRGRILLLIAMTLVSLLAATVAIGQVSRDFDLACRGLLLAGGRVTSGGNFAIVGAMGAPIIPPKDSETTPTYAVRSASYGVRAGFLPAYPNDASADAALEHSDPLRSDQDIVQRLPILYKIGPLIRGGC